MEPESILSMDNKEDGIIITGSKTFTVGIDVEAELTKILSEEMEKSIRDSCSLIKLWNTFNISKNIGTFKVFTNPIHHSIQTFKNDDPHGVRIKFKHEKESINPGAEPTGYDYWKFLNLLSLFEDDY